MVLPLAWPMPEECSTVGSWWALKVDGAALVHRNNTLANIRRIYMHVTAVLCCFMVVQPTKYLCPLLHAVQI